MKHENFPALYRSSDELSLCSQKAFFRALFWHLLFLVVATVISIINCPSKGLAIAQAAVLLGALSCSIYLFAAKPDRDWYAARAIAESIKTITWRFVSRAEPFDTEIDRARHHFNQTLKSIIEQNKDIAQRLRSDLDGTQVTDSMTSMRQSKLEERKRSYLECRITEQHGWYAKKALHNKNFAKWFFIALIVTNALAVFLAILKISFPTTPYWPTDIFLTIAAGILAWSQAKRFSELAASYTLATHEIGLIKEQSVRVKTEKEFSQFVGDAENAFSREHTQWVARKDV